MRRHRLGFRLLECAAAVFSGAILAAGPVPPLSVQAVRIGVLSTDEPRFYIDAFGPSMRFLRSRFPGTRFETEEFGTEGLLAAAGEGRFDFMILPAGTFAYAERTMGARALAAWVSPRYADPNRSTGSVLIVRADDSAQELPDLRGRVIAADDALSVEHWLAALYALKRAGLDPDEAQRRAKFAHFEFPDVPSLVYTGAADAGVLPLCSLERLLALQPGLKGAFRVLGSRESESESCVRSTELYPGRVFATLPGTNPADVRSIMLALLSMPAGPAGEWGIPNDFSKVESLYEELGIAPFPRRSTLGALWHDYREMILLALLLLAGLLLHAVRTEWMVKRRTRELRAAIRKKDRLAELNRAQGERIRRMERTAVISQMSSLLAHEVRQPIESLVFYAAGLKRYAGRRFPGDEVLGRASREIAQEARRVSDIVGRVRRYARAEASERRTLAWEDVLRRAVGTFRHSSKSQGVRLDIRGGGGLFVEADPLEIELAVVNLLRNAADAVSGQEERRIFVESGALGESLCCTVSDNGPRLAAEDFEKLQAFHPTTREDGMGLGIGLVRSIAESHGGHLCYEQLPQRGVAAKLFLPLAPGPKEVNHEAARSDR